MATGSKSSIAWAIFGNFSVMCAKFLAFWLTGAGSLLAEGIHSLADVLNQALLFLGVTRAERNPDELQARGYGREQYVWSLISAVGIFFLGCGVTLYHGVHMLFTSHPEEVSDFRFWVGVAVLIFSLLVEGAVLMIAFRETKKRASGSILSYLKDDPDPALVAVLLEDSAACLGVLFALFGIGLSHLTGSSIWDAIGTIAIAILLGVIAVWLVRLNARFLVGRGLHQDELSKVSGLVAEHKFIEGLDHLHSESIGPGRYELQLELDFDEDELVKSLEIDLNEAYRSIDTEAEFVEFCQSYGAESMRLMKRTIDGLEDEIRGRVKGLDYIDIEPN